MIAGQGCAAKQRPSREAAAGGSGLQGRIAYEVLPEPQPATPVLSARQVFMAPDPLETPLPNYPAGAIAKGVPPVVVMVRIIIHEDGAVRQVLDSPREQSREGDDHVVFRQAVQAAVRNWKYRPATIRTYAEGEDINGDGQADNTELIEEQAVRTYLDLLFTFEVVKGRARVRVAPPG